MGDGGGDGGVGGGGACAESVQGEQIQVLE